MDYYIYTVEGEARISLFFDIDKYYWSMFGNKIKFLGISKKITALVWANNRNDFDTELSITHDIWIQLENLADFIFTLLNGKVLIFSEIKAILLNNKVKISVTSLLSILQILILTNRVRMIASVTKNKCNRCNAAAEHIVNINCMSCNDACVMCEFCVSMGRAKSCLPIFYFENNSDYQAITLQNKLQLTDAQNKKATEIRQCMESKSNELMVWAVTGAGKTELVASVLSFYLTKGHKVLWVSPRKDVVLELFPRMQKIFPQELNIVAKYGGSHDIWNDAPFVLATAHQAIRYYNNFDIVVVDEFDAFPLYGNYNLDESINRTKKKNGKTIYLTATIPVEWQHLNEQTTVVLPVRYHGAPLPVPETILVRALYKKINNFRKIDKLAIPLLNFLDSDSQVIIFIPTIKHINIVKSWLESFVSHQFRAEGVHSADPKRSQKVLEFRNKEIDILISTSILERGITVPNCHVVILFSDHKLYDKNALIQMSGRAGRAREFPFDKVLFVSEEITSSQKSAIKEITFLNDLAKKEGFLKK